MVWFSSMIIFFKQNYITITKAMNLKLWTSIARNKRLLQSLKDGCYTDSKKLRFVKCNNGVSAVEFAILAPVMLVFVYAILNFGIYYYYTTIVENSLFALSRAIIDSASRPSDLSAAQAIFNTEIGQLKTADLNGREVVLSVNPLTASSPVATSNPVSVYKVLPGEPVIIRVVYPRPELIPVDFLMDVWPKIFGNKVDISIMVEAK